MKRCLTLVSLAALSVAAYGQAPGSASTLGAATSSTTTQQSEATRTPSSVRGASVSAELTKGVDTKRAKVGDPIEARVTSAAKLPDGTELPRGTKLIGKVTDVRASSKQEKNAHLVFNIDHAQLKDGQQIPVHAALTSVTAPPQSSAADLPMSGGGATAGGSAAGASGSTAGANGSSAGAAPTAPSTPTMTSSQPVTSQGGTLTGGQDHVPVGNLPGVMLTGTSDANSAGSLDALGQNISLASGTKLTLNLSAGA